MSEEEVTWEGLASSAKKKKKDEISLVYCLSLKFLQILPPTL